MEQKSSILGHYNSRIMLLRSINSLSKLDVFSRVDSRELSCHKNIAMQTKNWKEKNNYRVSRSELEFLGQLAINLKMTFWTQIENFYQFGFDNICYL